MTGASRPRVLLAVTFYNGQDFARRTMQSIAGLEHPDFDLDVLVLDDASPAPGFSAHLAEVSAEVGAVYSCTPRNLGIPRNVNVGLATAQRLHYDYVVISNSDVIYARNALRTLVEVISHAPDAASVTAWSTNVDPYSLPNAPELFVESQPVADRIGEVLFDEFGTSTIDIPAGISFAMIVPVPVLDIVGLMDPVFGRGYGEESDWSARATSAGFRHLLATGAFVYHAGRGSTLAAGIVVKDDIADWANQRIVDHRSPMFRWNVDGFLRGDELGDAQARAVRRLVVDAASRGGYALIDPTHDWPEFGDEVVTVALRSRYTELCTAEWSGFVTEIDTDSTDVLGAIRTFFGGADPVGSNLDRATWEGASRFGYPVGI